MKKVEKSRLYVIGCFTITIHQSDGWMVAYGKADCSFKCNTQTKYQLIRKLTYNRNKEQTTTATDRKKKNPALINAGPKKRLAAKHRRICQNGNFQECCALFGNSLRSYTSPVALYPKRGQIISSKVA